MPIIRPFRGLRYDPAVVGDISKVIAPPYDIIYDEWRDKLYERNSSNIIKLIKTKEEPGDTEKNNKYTRAEKYIHSWIRDGILKLDEKPSIYVRSETYEINGVTKTRYGFIALLQLEDFGNGVHPHEKTLSAPRVDRLNLIKATHANLSQIFSIFSDANGEIQNTLLEVAEKTPVVEFMDEQKIIRKMWMVNDKKIIAHLQNTMKEREIIIADGHHRYETSLAFKELMEDTRQNSEEPFDYVSMYFSSADDPGMTILPTHRKVGGLHTFNEKVFFHNLSREFDITFLDNITLDKTLSLMKRDSENINIFGIYTYNGFAVARLKNPSNPKDVDVEVLHNVIIEKILGITPRDITKGKYLHFCKSPKHAYDDIAYGKDQISFFMNAITSKELFRVVLNGRRMPQKSTYFYPKTLSGLVMCRIDRDSLKL